MKLKSYLLLGFAALAMTACDKDFDDWGQQATNTQPDAVTFGSGSVASVALIDFANIPEGQDSIQVCTITAPTSSYDETANKYVLTLNGEKDFELDAEGRIVYADFVSYVEGKYGKNPNYVREMTAVVTAYTGDGKTAVENILATSGTFDVKAKTTAPFIDSDGYYLVGNIDGWKCIKVDAWHLVNNGGDVYDNPEFSYELEPVADVESGDGVYNIKIIPASGFKEDGTIGNWGIALSALPGVSEPADEGSFSYSNEGDNIRFNAVAGAKSYKITINLMEGTYKVKAQNDPELYMTGNELGWGATWLKLFAVNANWDDSGYTKGIYWTIRYFKDGEQFKFAPVADWKDDFGGNQMSVTDNAEAGYTDDGTNCKVANGGWYLIAVDTKTQSLTISKPNIYLIGNVVGSWDADKAENLFTIPTTEDGEFVSPAFANSDNIRMYARVLDIDWWRTEFNVYGTSIVIRTEGDQDAVGVTAGQKAYLTFPDLKGRIE